MPSDQLHINESLLRLISGGDEDAFRVLFDHYRKRFHWVVMKMTGSGHVAEEITQEAFIKIWNQRESLEHVHNADAYFFTVVYRLVYKYYKKLAIDEKIEQAALLSPDSASVTEETVLARESQRVINEAIGRLPPQQQLIYKLSKIEGLSREEIAGRLNISSNTVRNHLAEAMKSLRIYLKDIAWVQALLFWLGAQ